MIASVWYCEKCRRVTRVDPPTALLTSERCRCKTPIVPLVPTMVYW